MKPLAFLALVGVAPAASLQLPPPSHVQESSGADAAVPEAWVAQITEDIRREEYGFSALGSGVFGAPNRAQELRSRVSARGLEVFPRSASAGGESAPWRLELRTRSFGRTDGELELGPAALEMRGERAELDHGPLVEWLENRKEGIEQGWTIAARPLGSEPLWIGLKLLAASPLDGQTDEGKAALGSVARHDDGDLHGHRQRREPVGVLVPGDGAGHDAAALILPLRPSREPGAPKSGSRGTSSGSGLPPWLAPATDVRWKRYACRPRETRPWPQLAASPTSPPTPC